MLQGIHPLLTGELLRHLDAMGHSDAVVVADAHFPAARLARNLVELPGTTSTDVVAAIRTVFPLDDQTGLWLMVTPDKEPQPIHRKLSEAAGVPQRLTAYVSREDFYQKAADAYVIVRTGEQRTYANALMCKGIVTKL